MVLRNNVELQAFAMRSLIWYSIYYLNSAMRVI
jgi:hypothetical protein